MIVCDATELRQGSKLPDIPGVVASDILEKLTGADIMVSPVSLPPKSEGLIKKHLERGAVLIQRKSGEDLIASIPTRLENSLAKMTSTAYYPYQSMLLFSGKLEISPAGMAIVNGNETGMSYMAVIGALDAWTLRGGTYINLPSDDLIPEFLRDKEKRIQDYSTHPVRYSYPVAPFQRVEDVTDWRITLATFPLIGEARAQKVKQELIRMKLGDSLLQALVYLTNGSIITPDGGGRTVVAACREWMGLPDGWNLDITPVGEKES